MYFFCIYEIINMSFFNNIQELNVSDFAGTDLKDPSIKYVVFYAPWCGYCVKLKGVLNNISDQIRIGSINADVSPDIAQKFNIKGFPTMYTFRNGMNQGEYSGDKTEEALIGYAQRNLDGGNNINPNPIPIVNPKNLIFGYSYLHIALIILLILLICGGLYYIMTNSSKSSKISSKIQTPQKRSSSNARFCSE